VARLFAEVREPRFQVLLRLIYGCGLRVGAALGLEIGDLQRPATRGPVCVGAKGQGRAAATRAAAGGGGRGGADVAAWSSQPALAVSRLRSGLGGRRAAGTLLAGLAPPGGV